MRAAAIVLLLISFATARAQYPYGYPRYRPPYPQYAPPSGPPASFARTMLAAHNAVRASVGVPPLAWSVRLAAVARDWADRLAATGIFAHRPDNPYGENLYEISGGVASPAEVVAAWANEARDYDIRTNSCTAVCGHYTQLVWATTRRVGCGVATGGDREVWVCDYDPPGNVIGFRPY